MNPLEFLLVELHYIRTLQQFTDQFRGVRSRAKVQVVKFLSSLQGAENLVQDAFAWIGRREQRAVVKPSARVLFKKFKIASREIDGIICGRPRNRELRHSGMLNLHLSGPSGEARSPLQKASIQIQRGNHLSGLLAWLIRTQCADQGYGMAQPARMNAEV